jgi:peptidyl-prolyl cis-trans isomerase SDCCAG10
MSQVYSTEPQTSGRVIFETTHGPVELQLWCRECPATTRLFLQLCLDGFYDKMLFHRIVPNFLIQTGALRHGNQQQQQEAFGNEKDMEAYRVKLNAEEALTRRSYELNSRIRFNHRGKVAMALEADNDNDSALLQPQFFITLDEASFLDGKHVVFGTVSGPTIFNCLRIGKTDVDEETNQPTELSEAPRVERVKIMENEIHTDIVPTEKVPWGNMQKKEATKKKKKRKGIKNVNVLSFGDEFEEEPSDGGGMKSSHDLIESKTLAKEVDEELKQASVRDETQPVISKKRKDAEETTTASQPPEDEKPERMVPYRQSTQRIASIAAAISGKNEIPVSGEAGKEQSPNKTEKKEKKMSLVEARRAKYAKDANKNKRNREEDTLAKLQLFQTKVVKNSGEDDQEVNTKDDAGYHGQVLEDGDDTGGDWLKTKFRCRKHMDIDAKLGGDGRNAMEDYEVVEGKSSDKNHRHRHRHHTHRR